MLATINRATHDSFHSVVQASRCCLTPVFTLAHEIRQNFNHLPTHLHLYIFSLSAIRRTLETCLVVSCRSSRSSVDLKTKRAINKTGFTIIIRNLLI